jgi:hypothetical protein
MLDEESGAWGSVWPVLSKRSPKDDSCIVPKMRLSKTTKYNAHDTRAIIATYRGIMSLRRGFSIFAEISVLVGTGPSIRELTRGEKLKQDNCILIEEMLQAVVSCLVT